MRKVNLHFGYRKNGELFTLPKCRAFVSEGRYTDDLFRVTCKHCLRILEKLWALAAAEK